MKRDREIYGIFGTTFFTATIKAHMDNQELQANWDKLKDKIKTEYPGMNIDDLEYQIGKEEELLLQLQKKLGKNRSEIDNWLALLG